jgi:Protein of unknown function (DUF3616)
MGSNGSFSRPRTSALRVKSASALLRFDPANSATEKLRAGLSAVVLDGDELWTVSDETASLERLIRVSSSSTREPEYAEHVSFALDSFFPLPVPVGSEGFETDIEALAIHDRDIWMVGSHSVNRDKPKGPSARQRIEALAKTGATGNRYLLARIPLARLRPDASSKSVPPAARLRGNAKGDNLTQALRADPHLGAYAHLPGKENGLDIEGLAVAAGGRVLLGLRGPVLGGYAVVLELRLEASRRDPTRLKLKRLPDDGQRYRKHFLDLGGLGIRDLCRDGADLLVLAGPTMKLDGPAAVYRWPGALRAKVSRVIERDGLVKLLDLPCGDGCDHPEGVALWPPRPREARSQATSVLIVHEKPSKRRLAGRSAMRAEIFALPRRR